MVVEFSYCKVWAGQSLHFNLALVWSSRLLNLLTNDGPGGAECLAVIVVITSSAGSATLEDSSVAKGRNTNNNFLGL